MTSCTQSINPPTGEVVAEYAEHSSAERSERMHRVPEGILEFVNVKSVLVA